MTTSSGSKARTNSRAWASAPLISSSRSCDGPGRFSSGLWDIQQRVSAIRTRASSPGEMENFEQGCARFRCALGDARGGDASIRPDEQHGIGVDVEPCLEGTKAVADDDHVGIV